MFTRSHTRIACLALALTALLAVAPVAGARTSDMPTVLHRSGNVVPVSHPNGGRQQLGPMRSAAVISTPPISGATALAPTEAGRSFDLADATIGAGAALLLTGLGLVTVTIGRGRRSGIAVPS